MTKICHITTVHSNRYDSRIFERECVSLAQAGLDTILIVNDELPDENKYKVKIVSLHTKPKNRIDRSTRIANLAYKKALEINAEIYHIHDPELLRIAVKLAKHNKKVIFDSHEFTAMQILTKPYLPSCVRNIISRLYSKYEVYALNQLSGLIYPCTYAGKDYFERVSIAKVLIGNYPRMATIDYVKHSLNEEERQAKACYVGGISESRGIFHMVKACGIAKCTLLLIGKMPLKIREQLEKMPEFEWVEILGELPHEKAIREIGKCSVGLSLLQAQGQYAKLDNLPTKLYEYMAMGIPTVVSKFPYYEHILEQYNFGIAVNPLDVEEIAKAINDIMSNPKLGRRMADEGRKCIDEEMNWEAEAKKLIDFYHVL